MKNKSLLKTNVYRKPHESLGEYTSKKLRDSHNCQIRKGWYSCDEGFGKVRKKNQILYSKKLFYLKILGND